MGNQARQPFYDPNASTYNPGWRNHPNLGWGGNQNSKNNNFQNRPPNQKFQRPPFQPPFQPQQPGLPNPQPKPPQPNSFEVALEKLSLTTTSFVQTTKQLSTTLPNAFTSNMEVNPKGECKAITLRSGKALEDKTKEVNVQPIQE
ncbi:hypothetical protein PIB30_091913, partial [Stylosanthes scabra]|nr:hypothetical protein [Stylosanthes scabra]